MTNRLLAAIVLLILLGGCGQSGPLYIPGNPSRMSVPPENPENVQQTERDDEEDGESPD